MYAYFVYFFEKSAEAEATINHIRRELQGADFDEFHFRSTDSYPDDSWKTKAAGEIDGADFLVFLYADGGADRDLSNVSYELDTAFERKKLVFMVPLTRKASGMGGVMESGLGVEGEGGASGVPRLDRLSGTKGRLIVTDVGSLMGYILSARDSRVSGIPEGMERIDRCVKELEESYGIASNNDRPLIFNRIQMDSVMMEKIRDGMVNSDRQGAESLTAQYAAMFESIENLDERRETNNTVYTTINTALIALIATSLSLIMGSLDSPAGLLMIAIMFGFIPAVGIGMCRSWERTLARYKDLRKAKFRTLDLVESLLPLNLNKAEWEILKSRNYVTATEGATLPKLMKRVYLALIGFGVVLALLSVHSMAGPVGI